MDCLFAAAEIAYELALPKVSFPHAERRQNRSGWRAPGPVDGGRWRKVPFASARAVVRRLATYGVVAELAVFAELVVDAASTGPPLSLVLLLGCTTGSAPTSRHRDSFASTRDRQRREVRLSAGSTCLGEPVAIGLKA